MVHGHYPDFIYPRGRLLRYLVAQASRLGGLKAGGTADLQTCDAGGELASGIVWFRFFGLFPRPLALAAQQLILAGERPQPLHPAGVQLVDGAQ
jgi:hypothetical protein